MCLSIALPPQSYRVSLRRFEIALKIDSEKILIPSLLPSDDEVTYSIPSEVRYFERQVSIFYTLLNCHIYLLVLISFFI